MKLYNIKEHNEQVSFSKAIRQGIGKNQGLYFPINLPTLNLSEINILLNMDFISRSARIVSLYIGDELSYDNILKCIVSSFTFPAPIVPINNDIATLELFHGPTLAFKDFGARFMAQMLIEMDRTIKNKQPTTILTATSGDTGAAVAHAFYGLSHVNVVILYPQGKISILQEKLFCTLGGNIHAIAIDGDFDACQSLVKQAFNDYLLRSKLNLNSANSINISRLLAQICYYFEAISQLPKTVHNNIVIAVPSGNFGNLTAGLLAKSLGLPVKRFIIATNVNDTVPRFIRNHQWMPHPTVRTLSNAMDISEPNNWPRIMELFRRKKWPLSSLTCGSVNDDITCKTLKEMLCIGYVSEPHAAVAYRVLRDQLHPGEFGIFLGTAHPVKFKELLESVFGNNLSLLTPSLLVKYLNLPLLSQKISSKFCLLKELLLRLIC